MKKDMRKWLKQYKEDFMKQFRTLIQDNGTLKILILVAAGIVLIVLSFPEQKKEKVVQKEEKTVSDTASYDSHEDTYVKHLEEELEEMLKQVPGIGDVDVMITLKSSSKTIVNKDVTKSENRNSNQNGDQKSTQNGLDVQEETVLVEGENGEQIPYVVQTIEPEIAGIVVICEGGDQIRVVNDITSAAEVLFSVSPHKVKVMKKNS